MCWFGAIGQGCLAVRQTHAARSHNSRAFSILPSSSFSLACFSNFSATGKNGLLYSSKLYGGLRSFYFRVSQLTFNDKMMLSVFLNTSSKWVKTSSKSSSFPSVKGYIPSPAWRYWLSATARRQCCMSIHWEKTYPLLPLQIPQCIDWCVVFALLRRRLTNDVWWRHFWTNQGYRLIKQEHSCLLSSCPQISLKNNILFSTFRGICIGETEAFGFQSYIHPAYWVIEQRRETPSRQPNDIRPSKIHFTRTKLTRQFKGTNTLLLWFIYNADYKESSSWVTGKQISPTAESCWPPMCSLKSALKKGLLAKITRVGRISGGVYYSMASVTRIFLNAEKGWLLTRELPLAELFQ